ncbi:MAG: response regulator [Candidatus Omnitrophica bacterium]|nr:response regulator [Candidatus Omnitrophota bacterium]
MENTEQEHTSGQLNIKKDSDIDLKAGTILVIDDELGPRESLKMLFKNDYRIITADSGDEGIEAFRENNPDIIILDLKMPGKSGLETLEEIRMMDEKVPVIILTGYGDMDAAKKAIHLGTMEFISKPFDIAEIRKIVREGCEKRRLEKRSEKLVAELNTLNNGLKERMGQLENMATIGQLSAEIMHEVNNLLTVIYGYAQILMKELDSKNLAAGNKKYVNIIENEIKRCKNITRSVITLSKTKMELTDVDINGIAEKIVELFESSNIGKDVKFAAILDKKLPFVKADANQMHQAIVNIVLNSIQSIKGAGSVTLTTGLKDNSVFLSVKDTGKGISGEAINKITDPFFTDGKKDGTGLGLSITARIIKNHRGKLEIKSSLNEGSEFVISMPAA